MQTCKAKNTNSTGIVRTVFLYIVYIGIYYKIIYDKFVKIQYIAMKDVSYKWNSWHIFPLKYFSKVIITYRKYSWAVQIWSTKHYWYNKIKRNVSLMILYYMFAKVLKGTTNPLFLNLFVAQLEITYFSFSTLS